MAQPLPTLGAKTRSTLLFRSIRTRNGFVAEADATTDAMSSKRFARAIESAQCDAAILVDIQNFEDIPDDPTDRFYEFSRRYKGKSHPNAIMVDVKSFRWQPQFREDTRKEGKGKDRIKICIANISNMAKSQVEKCQVLIIANMMDPDFVAVIPKPYIRIIQGNERQVSIALGLSTTHTIAAMCPLPPELSAFIMPSSCLAAALESIASCANNTVNQVRNPHSGVLWSRLTAWQPDLSPFDDLLPSDSATEYRIKKLLRDAFKAHEMTGIRIKLPHYSPITSDIVLEHTSGATVFIEIKVSTIRVTTLSNGTVRLEHNPCTMWGGQVGIFTVTRMSWDYMLCLPTKDSAIAWLIRREDWPRPFWHRQPPPGQWLSQVYPDSSFFDAREITLNAGHAVLVNDVWRIVCPQGTPEPARLTPEQVLEFAGPCPRGLLIDESRKTGGDRPPMEPAEQNNDQEDELDTSHREASHMDQLENEDMENEDAEGPDQELDQDEAPDQDVAWRGARFVTMTASLRLGTAGGNEMNRTGQLYIRLMNESRHKGEGCPIYLGHRHAMGSIGFVQHYWDENDKRVFDTTGRPPCWIGNLSNETPIVTLLQQSSRWRIEYAPNEGTSLEIAAIARAHPCLVLAQSFPREIDHTLEYVWLVPSEFIPKTSLGRIRLPDNGSCRCPLFLSGENSIDRFGVKYVNLHATVAEFLKGKESINIGLDNVPVNPTQYVKNVLDHRQSAEVNYERCFSAVRQG